MRVLIAVLVFAPMVSAQTVETPARSLTAKEKLELRILRVVSPITQIGVVAGAAIDQREDEPGKWGQGWGAYGTRVASAEGVNLSYNAVGATADLIFRLDPRYRRMPNGTFKARLWNAISQEFLAYKDSGGRVINVSTLAGSYGSEFISNTWEPAGSNKASDALTSGTLSIATHTGGNVAREFLPDLMRRFRHSPQSPASSPASNKP
jgi:hypothetical protein